MLIPRLLTPHLQELTKYYPIISLTGPRQAGKTTLLRFLFPNYEYVSLENPDNRVFAQKDPNSFLARYGGKTIFDEAQRVPELFSYLQTKVDLNKQPGQYVLSGSQNFLLHQNISQSLAGRVGISRLLPFSYNELKAAEVEKVSMEETIYQGFFPGLFDLKIPPHLFYPNYVETYLQRDVQDLINPGNLSQFHRFLQLCAGHVGQLINYNALSSAMGVNVATIKSWLSILEQSYTIFQLFPFYKNFNKRLVKTPKLYFYDTGLVCNLLRMKDSQNVHTYYQKGALFENFVIADIAKQAFHKGERPELYFWRDNHGNEMDVVKETIEGMQMLEIKSTRTLAGHHFKGVNKFKRWLNDQPVKFFMAYGGDDKPHTRENGIEVLSWQDLDQF